MGRTIDRYPPQLNDTWEKENIFKIALDWNIETREMYVDASRSYHAALFDYRGNDIGAVIEEARTELAEADRVYTASRTEVNDTWTELKSAMSDMNHNKRW